MPESVPQIGSGQPESASDDESPVVGIGASAGGLDAFTRLLRHLPPDTGYAFVLVQHLDANHPSSLSEILGRATGMPVAEARDGQRVEPNHVYVIPPNTELTIADRALRLAPREPAAARRPVDRFLQSLAADCGARAIGVVLSGSGSDGTAGLMAIKDAGGVTFAQEPGSAEFSNMPSAAAAGGGADVVLRPEDIASELARMARHPQFSTSPRGGTALPNAVADDAKHLRAICDVMHEATGIDFSWYRETTVQRRILRRLAIRNVENLGAYAQLLGADPDERAALQRDLLIGVTSFFRDPESFEALKRLVFPALVGDRPPESPIRIWVPGCATGEEVYSLLIALREFQDQSHTAFPVQVFGSDIHEAAIERARKGKYPDSIAADVSPDRLRQYFSKAEGSYQIIKDLREQCVFSRHNLLDDPPFSKLDLISCRNVLIYLATAHTKLMGLFHYALVDHGFLMLGRAETPHNSDLFSAVEPGQRIYARKHVSRRPFGAPVGTRTFGRGAESTTLARQTVAPKAAGDVSRDADRILLSKYSPTGVLVDDALEVLEIRGQTAPFLTLTAGKASLHLLKFLPDTGLFLAAETLVQEAAKTQEPAQRHGVAYEADGRAGELSIEVTPLRGREGPAYLILFEPAALPVTGEAQRGSRRSPGPGNDGSGSRIAKLTQELEAARARLVSLVDEHEASDEESQQATEEALSANEELQSLSEELETAKEELQSTNEELLTVNRELEARNVALASAGNLAKVTVETVGVPLAVVDAELIVRHINAAFAREFQLSIADAEGRRFSELCGGAWNVPYLRVQLEGLRVEGVPFDRCEIEREFPSIGSRVLLISGCRLAQLDLMLLTVEDVTGQREAEKALRRSEEQRRQSEKMETVGRLAGGIAHDFNNLLTVILGNAGLIGDALGWDHEAIEGVNEIRHSAERAASLTDQLLSFSRRKVLQPKLFDLNPLVVDFERMLRRVLSERIKIVLRTSPDACLVRADPAEIGRVVMNLCLNARDAMPTGGVLTVETGHVVVDEHNVPQDGVHAGRYARLVIGDTGLGMDDDTRLHAFEPFFTTKDASKGAGLGLATVVGILQQSGGAVSCDSEIGRGTRFTVLLPAVTGIVRPAEPGSGGLADVPVGSSEVVLLVEDDDAVRSLTKRVLSRSGYVVLDATDGREALSAIESHEGRIDLLISDVLMPEMSGGVLVERARILRPDLKVLFVSGHTEDVLVKEGVTKGMPFLQKPYAPGDLARKVREVLDSKVC